MIINKKNIYIFNLRMQFDQLADDCTRWGCYNILTGNK